MTRLFATVATDVRIQFRNGFYVASAFMAICTILLPSWFSTQNATILLPALLFETVLINSFYFVAGLLLLERTEGTLVAQGTTPLRLREYLISKVLTLAALSLAECLAISAMVGGLGLHLLAQGIGVLLASALFGLTGVAVASLYESVNQFLLPSSLYMFLLSLPLLGYFGVGEWTWYLPHPLQGPMELLRVETAHGLPLLGYAILYPLLWTVAAYRWSRRALLQARTA